MAKGAFKALEGKLAGKPGVTNPGGLAAFIGDQKYGKGKMAAGAKAAKPVSGAKKPAPKQAAAPPPKMGRKGC